MAPTLSPSHVPSASPSSAPTLSAAPSTLAPTFPPVELSKFEWDLDRVGTVRLAFTEEYDYGEIMLDYNISLRDVDVQLFEIDCSTPVSPTVATASGIATQTSYRHASLTVNVDVIQENVTSSPIWNAVSVGEGEIKLCVRVDLLHPSGSGTSVHFHEQKLLISVGLLQGFTVATVDVSRTNATEEDGTAVVNYNILACQCNSNLECVALDLTQGSEVSICVKSLDDGVEIVGIDSLSFTQGSYSIDSIVDGQVDQFTAVSIIDESALIRNQMLSVFFEQLNPEDVVAQGFALLGFTDETGRKRFLRTSIKSRVMVERSMDSFALALGVESSLADNSGTVVRMGSSLMSVTAVLIGTAILIM